MGAGQERFGAVDGADCDLYLVFEIWVVHH